MGAGGFPGRQCVSLFHAPCAATSSQSFLDLFKRGMKLSAADAAGRHNACPFPLQHFVSRSTVSSSPVSLRLEAKEAKFRHSACLRYLKPCTAPISEISVNGLNHQGLSRPLPLYFPRPMCIPNIRFISYLDSQRVLRAIGANAVLLRVLGAAHVAGPEVTSVHRSNIGEAATNFTEPQHHNQHTLAQTLEPLISGFENAGRGPSGPRPTLARL